MWLREVVTQSHLYKTNVNKTACCKFWITNNVAKIVIVVDLESTTLQNIRSVDTFKKSTSMKWLNIPFWEIRIS